MSRQRFARRGQNSTSYQEATRRFGPITSSVVLVVLACLLGMLYLTQVTHTNTLSYKINDFQERQQALKTEQEELQVSSARLQAADNIKNSEAAKNLLTVAPSAVIQQ